jgi:hypothetical protein
MALGRLIVLDGSGNVLFHDGAPATDQESMAFLPLIATLEWVKEGTGKGEAMQLASIDDWSDAGRTVQYSFHAVRPMMSKFPVLF